MDGIWIVEESDALGEKTVQVSGGPGADGADLVARWKLSEEAVSRA